PRLGARHPTPSVELLLKDSKQSSSSTPRRPAPMPSVETTSVLIKAKNQHSARPRPGARHPTPSVEQPLRQNSSSADPTPKRHSSMPRRGKLMTATEAAVSHA
ncbi:hypothetical protein PIB30_114924, partial [Stylosanthes scabra]|nr:hypothetical protein [Stylosanthes scabra]